MCIYTLFGIPEVDPIERYAGTYMGITLANALSEVRGMAQERGASTSVTVCCA